MAFSSAISSSSFCSCGVSGSRRGLCFSGLGAGFAAALAGALGLGGSSTAGASGSGIAVWGSRTGSCSVSSGAAGSSASSRSASVSSSRPSTISPVGGSSVCSPVCGAALASCSACPVFSRRKNRPSKPLEASFACSSSRRFISWGTCATLVLKNVRNFSFCALISSCVSSLLRLSSFGISVPPCSGPCGKPRSRYCCAAR